MHLNPKSKNGQCSTARDVLAILMNVFNIDFISCPVHRFLKSSNTWRDSESMAYQNAAYEIQHSFVSNENDRNDGLEENLSIQDIFFALKIMLLMELISCPLKMLLNFQNIPRKKNTKQQSYDLLKTVARKKKIVVLVIGGSRGIQLTLVAN